jgi:hypothetical protein
MLLWNEVSREHIAHMRLSSTIRPVGWGYLFINLVTVFYLLKLYGVGSEDECG